MEKKHNPSIDILKFLAVLLVVNSHSAALYPESCRALATGGAIGDVLFFFSSGYTLFLGRMDRFDAWYKRRIRRIYPSVIAVALLASCIWDWSRPLYDVFLRGGEWFVSCIMIYYVLLYFVRRYAANHLTVVYCLAGCVILGWYAMFFEPMRSWLPTDSTLLFAVPSMGVWIYKWNYLKWGMYFPFMLMGAHVGMKESQEGSADKEVCLVPIVAKLVLSLAAFYGLQLFCLQNESYSALQILSLLPLLGVCFYFYRLTETQVMLRLFAHPFAGRVMSVIGGLCLEIYLVQAFVRTTELNHLFPLNLLILFIAMVLAAYVCRAIGRFFQQTFSAVDGYRWKEILSLTK